MRQDGHLDDGYDYDANANVAAITDGATGRNQRGNQRGNRTMTYDGLDRLKTVASPMYGATGANYAYDVLDNLTSLTVGGSHPRTHHYHYDSIWRLVNVIDVNTGGSVVGLGYDEQGNLANKNGQAFDFDFGNRLRLVTGKESYRYDGHGRRVLSWSATGLGNILSQYDVNGVLRIQNDGRKNKLLAHFYLGGSLVATRETPIGTTNHTTKYQHTDALGSPVVVTDANRNELERSEYEPYGQVLNRPVSDGPGYTGHVMDAATGLVYAQQRYYDPMIGRFLSVDPVTADAATGANFNRYWYAANNPYKFTDPDGREIVYDRSAPPDFLRNVANAIRYLNAHGLAGNIGRVHMDSQQVKVAPASDRYDIYQNGYDADTNTLYWADKAGLEFTDPQTGEVGMISPALALGHEFEHTLNEFTDHKSYARDVKTFDSQFNTQEERNVIEEYEQPAASELGEPVRQDHSSGKPTVTECVTKECAK